jgi:hypothetical protein
MTVPYTFANRTGNIPLSELDANFSNVSAFSTTAGTVTTASQPNITHVGTLTSLTVSGGITGSSVSVTGNLTGGNIIGTVVGNISNAVYATTAGTVTTNAQPNITSVGTLSSLTVTGNISATGNVLPGNVVSTGLIRGLTVLATGNLAGGNANITTSVNTVTVNASNIIAGNISATQITTTGNISVGNILSSLPQTKASNATGTTGQICWDSNYIYVCTATDTWKRAGLIGGY